MLRNGANWFDGMRVEVLRKRIRRLNLRVNGEGTVVLSIPVRGATLAEGEKFLRANWAWAMRERAKALVRPSPSRRPLSPEERTALATTLSQLMALWCTRLGETGVAFAIRDMKTLWGSCHWAERKIVFAAALARESRESVEYVVVHELAHLRVHDHGPRFRALMDEHLPDWRVRRKALRNRYS